MDTREEVLLELRERERERERVVSEEAAYWLLRCRDDALGGQEQRKFLSWLRRSPENVAELLRVLHLNSKLSHAKLVLKNTKADQSNVVKLAPAEERYVGDRVSRQGSASWKIAAVAATVTLSFLLLMMTKIIWFDRAVSTDPSEWVHQRLTDGSVMHVGPRSDLSLAFGDNRRSVHLARGEAIFEVAKDPMRPFKVSTDLAEVRAVGTRFAVTRYRGVIVTVSEGVVIVTPYSESGSAAPVTVRAGEQVTVSDDGLTSSVAKVDAVRKLEWAEGWIVVDGETVAEAVNEFNRRNHQQIVVDSPVVAASRLNYYRFKVNDPRSFAEIVAQRPDIALERDPATGVLRLQRE